MYLCDSIQKPDEKTELYSVKERKSEKRSFQFLKVDEEFEIKEFIGDSEFVNMNKEKLFFRYWLPKGKIQ
jgi:hypothetical protein